MCRTHSGSTPPINRYLVVSQKVDNKGVMMLCCRFCNKVFQGTQIQATRHFSQTNYCKDVSDEALYEIARRSQQKFEADQMERVARNAAERGLDVPGTGGARGGEAGRRPVEGGVGEMVGMVRQIPLWVVEAVRRRRASPRAVLPNHCEIASMRAVETHRAELAEELEEVRQPFWVTGATLLSDGRKSRDGRPIVNFLAAGSRGVGVYTTINREGEADIPVHVLRRWVTNFHEFSFGGPQRINAICTDSASAYVGAARALASPSMPPALRRIIWLPGMTEEEIARQVALITRDSIGASAPPSADVVFDRRACIFRPYPREDDSDEEPVPEAADDPALRIPREIDETHEDPYSKETRAHPARRAADRAEREMLGGEEFWGPFRKVASTGGPKAQATIPTPTRRESSMPPPPAPSPASPSPVSPLQPATATADREELGSSLPQRGLLHRGGAVHQLRLRSPSPGILQEEGAPSAAAVESSMAPAVVSDAMIAAAVEDIAAAAAAAVAAAGGAGGAAAEVEVEVAATVEEEAPSTTAVEGEVSGPVEEEIAAQVEVQRGGDDERLMQQFLTEELDPVIAEEARRREIEGDCVQGGVVAGEAVTEVVAAEPGPKAMPGGAEAADIAVEGWPQAVDEVVKARQRRVEGAINERHVVSETATGPVVPFSILHLAQGRQSQAVQIAVHGVSPPVITDLGSEPVIVTPRLPSHFAPQEVRRPLDVEELATEAVRDVARLDRWIFDRRLEHPAWQTIHSVPWGPASLVWFGSTSTGGYTMGHVPRVSGGVTETAPRTGDMPPPPPRAPVGLQPGLGPRGGRTTAAKEVPASGCEPQRGRGRGVSTETLEYALRAATRAVQEQTPRKRGALPRPHLVPAEGGAALGESSGEEGFEMPRGSRREQTVAEASARVVVLRKGGGPVTIEEDDPDTDAAVREADEDYEGEEGREEERRSGSDGDDDDDDDDDEPPPPPGPPPTRASRRSAARTSSSS
ncbi:hypothetical protein CBR_g31383 [Chara braunii]|uniref:DUF659 domain-containing protein n=1 Tax=Chara braunii TaxID=69332 RepID=A0A388LEZ2_CHABU|nr:hypothetical protein CBR_g31383 [Chara braunii]|eukprot:GBG80827.1 hypothetical protein CBR_g31383 [Chara braunii]